MKKILAISLLSISTVVAVVLAACGRSDSTQPVAAPAVPQTCVNGQCYNYYGYPYQYPSNTTIQFTARKLDPSYGYYGSYYQIGSLQIMSGFRNVLKEAMGVCDRNDINGGQAACDSWMNGSAEVALQADSTTTSGYRLLIKAAPAASYLNYYYSTPNLGNFFMGWLTGFYGTNPQGFFNPMILNTTTPYTMSSGFEIRANGPTYSMAGLKLFQLQVTSGSITGTQLVFQLVYNGVVVATGTMQNCVNNGYNYCTYL